MVRVSSAAPCTINSSNVTLLATPTNSFLNQRQNHGEKDREVAPAACEKVPSPSRQQELDDKLAQQQRKNREGGELTYENQPVVRSAQATGGCMLERQPGSAQEGMPTSAKPPVEDAGFASEPETLEERNTKDGEVIEDTTPEEADASRGASQKDRRETIKTILAAQEEVEVSPPVDEVNIVDAVPAESNVLVRPEAKRFDFGPGLFTWCSACGKFSLNRGDQCTRKVYCIGCFRSRVRELAQLEGPTAADEPTDELHPSQQETETVDNQCLKDDELTAEPILEQEQVPEEVAEELKVDPEAAEPTKAAEETTSDETRLSGCTMLLESALGPQHSLLSGSMMLPEYSVLEEATSETQLGIVRGEQPTASEFQTESTTEDTNTSQSASDEPLPVLKPMEKHWPTMPFAAETQELADVDGAEEITPVKVPTLAEEPDANAPQTQATTDDANTLETASEQKQIEADENTIEARYADEPRPRVPFAAEAPQLADVDSGEALVVPVTRGLFCNMRGLGIYSCFRR